MRGHPHHFVRCAPRRTSSCSSRCRSGHWRSLLPVALRLPTSSSTFTTIRSASNWYRAGSSSNLTPIRIALRPTRLQSPSSSRLSSTSRRSLSSSRHQTTTSRCTSFSWRQTPPSPIPSSTSQVNLGPLQLAQAQTVRWLWALSESLSDK